MTYFVFVNPTTLAVIRNDNLSKSFGSSVNLKEGYPGVATILMDYNKQEIFNEIWIVYGEIIESQKPLVKSYTPTIAFIDEIKARKHVISTQNIPSEWGASTRKNTTIDVIPDPLHGNRDGFKHYPYVDNSLRLKKIRI